MGAQPYSLELPRSHRSWSITMAGLVVAVLAAGAILGIDALRGNDVEVPHPAAELSVYRGAVTGTGPALESVAGPSLAAYEGAVTGTGPGLLQMDGAAPSGFAGAVTGTGPGLVEIAGDAFTEYRSSAITGTGPGLSSIGR